MKQFIRHRLPGGRLARNIVTMAGATAGGQLIVLLALPVLTRLYTPAEFGAAGVFGGAVALFAVVAALRYELAIPLPRRDRAAFHLVVLASVILVAIAALAGLTWLLLGRWLDLGTGLNNQAFAALISIGVLSAGGYQIANYWAIRKAAFRTIAKTRIQQGLAGNGTQIALGLTGFGAVGMILGQIVGQCSGILRLASAMWADHRKTGGRIHARGLAWAARRYRQFPLFDGWAGLVNVAGGQAPVLLFAALFSPALAGYYALAYRVLSAPIGLIGKAVSQPLLAQVAAMERSGGDPGPLMKKLLGALAMLSLPPFAFAAALSADIVPLALGSQWAPAAPVVAWTAIWVGWQFIASPLSVILIAIEAQKLNALLQVGLLVLRVLPLLAGAALGSSDIALMGFSIASLFGYAIYTAATGKAVGLKVVDMVRATLRPILLAGCGLTIAVALPEHLVGVRYAAVALLCVVWLWLCWVEVRLRLRPLAAAQDLSAASAEVSQ